MEAYAVLETGGKQVLVKAGDTIEIEKLSVTEGEEVTLDTVCAVSDGTTLKDVGIPAGGTVLVRFDIDSAFISQWKSYNAMPTQAMVSAAFRNDED